MIFTISFSLSVALVAIIMPKNLNWIEIYTTSLFASLFSWVADVFLDIRLHLYSYFEPNRPDFAVMWITLITYPAVSAIFLNFFPNDKKLLHKISYILAWSILAVVFELLYVNFHVLHYHNWSIWYSACLYPFLYLILVINLMLTKKLLSKRWH